MGMAPVMMAVSMAIPSHFCSGPCSSGPIFVLAVELSRCLADPPPSVGAEEAESVEAEAVDPGMVLEAAVATA